jgi:hypothetical protein
MQQRLVFRKKSTPDPTEVEERLIAKIMQRLQGGAPSASAPAAAACAEPPPGPADGNFLDIDVVDKHLAAECARVQASLEGQVKTQLELMMEVVNDQQTEHKALKSDSHTMAAKFEGMLEQAKGAREQLTRDSENATMQVIVVIDVTE